MKKTVIFLLLVVHAAVFPVYAEHPWKIVSAADWHTAERGVLEGGQLLEKEQKIEEELIKGTVFCEPDVVLVAGDVAVGHWVSKSLKKYYPADTTINDMIRDLGEKSYRRMRDNFAAQGVDKLLVCVGDHDVGDNNWGVGTERSKNVEIMREVYGRCFNTDKNGKWVWDEKIGDVPARPLGTKYALTSFAHRHKNVLFVNVDVFEQESPMIDLDAGYGTVSPDITGKHLEWFERLLKAAKSDPGIRYIFVQGHPPCLAPVRSQRSSLIYIKDHEKSNLWQAMRKYDVDLYFAGEVHATTITKDPESNIIQVVTDRAHPTMITVYDDKLELNLFDRRLVEASKKIHKEHKLTIKKSVKGISLEGTGLLKPLDTSRVFIHYSFETEKLPEDALFLEEGRLNVFNKGELGDFSNGCRRPGGVEPGIIGKSLNPSQSSAVYIHGMGLFGFTADNVSQTMAIWLKTTASGEYNLVCAGRFRLFLANGILSLQTSAGVLKAAGPVLNDGKWHHAAYVVLPDAKTTSDVQLFCDGKLAAIDSEMEDKKISVRAGIHGLSVGGKMRPPYAHFDNPPSDEGAFPGTLDDFAAWYRALSPCEVLMLYENAITKKLDASAVDKLFLEK